MSITETGDAWDLSNPLKPIAILDPNDIWDVPFSVAPLVAVVGFPYASHSILCGPELECSTSTFDDIDTITARFKQASGQVLATGTTYSATFRIVLTNGESRDKTLYFKMKAR